MGQAAHASSILRGRTCFMLIEGQDGYLSLSDHHHDVDDLATLVWAHSDLDVHVSPTSACETDGQTDTGVIYAFSS